MGGDWNCTLNFTLDRNGEEQHAQSSFCLDSIIKSLHFSDVWREYNPTTRQYTWVKVTNNRVFAARLDRIYVSQNMRNRILKTSIMPTSLSDHKLITAECSLEITNRKSCYWHFQVKLLEDIKFCEYFIDFWETWKREKNNYEDITQWWEVGKVHIRHFCQQKVHIRHFCQQYTSHSSLVLKNTIDGLEKEIMEIEKDMIESEPLILKELWEGKKKELSSILNEKVKGVLVKSRFTAIRDVDGPTTFFFNLERKAGIEKRMFCLKDTNGHDSSDPEDMRGIAVEFYSELYAVENTEEQCRNELLQDLPKITQGNRLSLETELNFEELTTAVMGLSSGRAPGLDGLPADFYKTFWNIIGKDFLEVLQNCLSKGILPTSCQRAVLMLLPKKGDLTLLKNWRPVAMLCSDYKIYSKVLANRLNGVLHEIVHKDQSYCVKNRCISDNLHLVRDAIDFAIQTGINVGFLSLDQEKAFDRVDHIFLFETLKAFGFGDSFISKVKMLYTEATCMVKIAGGLSFPIKVQRGIRQGCPLSGLLYSIAIEPLLCRLRRELKGLNVDAFFHQQIKLSAYADDVTVLIRDQNDVKVLEKALVCYNKACSAKVNWGKSDALWCGQEPQSPSLPGDLKWGRAGFKYLGVFLGTEDFRKKNWEGLLEKVCVRLSHWKWVLPQLSYRGRVLVCNNLAAASLWHRMRILEPPEDLVRRLQKCLVDFFWSGQHWLKASVLYLPIQEGGQGLVDIRSRIKAFRLQTVKKLLYGEDVSWAGIACTLLRRAGNMGLDRHLFLMDINKIDLTGIYSSWTSTR